MRVAVFSQDPAVGRGVEQLLSEDCGFVSCGVYYRLEDVERAIADRVPDALIFSEDFDGPDTRRAIRSRQIPPSIPTVLVHPERSRSVAASDEFDAACCRLDGIEPVCTAIRQAVHRKQDTPKSDSGVATIESILGNIEGRKLSVREREIALLVADGLGNREISEIVGLEETTIKLYVSRLLRAFGSENRVKLAIKIRGLEPVSPHNRR